MPGIESASRSAAAPTTRARLIAAAAVAFNSSGYLDTDSNKIARAAGFAPQTFYRHFNDKLDIFIAVYERWLAEEFAAIRLIAETTGDPAAIAAAVLDHHVQWRLFRRSLRMLAAENDRVRTARAESRRRQIASLARLDSNAGRPVAEIAAALLAVERLCDALAEGEFADLGIQDASLTAPLTAAVRLTRAPPPH